MGAHDDHGAAAGEVDPQLLAARDEVAAVGHVAPQHGAQEVRLRGLGRPLGRAQALDLGGDQRGDDPQQRGRRLAAERPRRRSRPTTASPTRSSCVTTPAASVISDRSSAPRARGDREHVARAVDQDKGGVQRAGRGAHHLGESEAALHGLRDGLEGAEVRRRRHLACGYDMATSQARSAPGPRSRRNTRGSRRRGRTRRARTLRARRSRTVAARRSQTREYDVQAGTSTSTSQAMTEMAAAAAPMTTVRVSLLIGPHSDEARRRPARRCRRRRRSPSRSRARRSRRTGSARAGRRGRRRSQRRARSRS